MKVIPPQSPLLSPKLGRFQSKRTASLGDTRTNLSETEARSRRKSLNSFVEKSAHILHAYDALFKKPHQYSTGDADTQFRQSLRNYDNEFQLSKAFRLPLKSSRVLKSLQSLEGITSVRTKNLLQSSHAYWLLDPGKKS